VNQLSHPLIIDRARLAGAHFVIDSVDALIQKPKTLLAHRGARELQAMRDLAVGLSVSRRQHDARPRDQRAEIERERAIDISCERSSSFNTSFASGRPIDTLMSSVPPMSTCHLLALRSVVNQSLFTLHSVTARSSFPKSRRFSRSASSSPLTR
jgi:hypothetical protein